MRCVGEIDHDPKAMAIVGVWALIGVVWVLVNPAKRGTKMLDPAIPQRQPVAV